MKNEHIINQKQMYEKITNYANLERILFNVDNDKIYTKLIFHSSNSSQSRRDSMQAGIFLILLFVVSCRNPLPVPR